MSLSCAGPDCKSPLVPPVAATSKLGGVSRPPGTFLAFLAGSLFLQPTWHLVLHKPSLDHGNEGICCRLSPAMGQELLSQGGRGCSEHGTSLPGELRPTSGTSKGAKPPPKQPTLRAAPQNKPGLREG